MGRPWREEYNGGIYHVIARGNNKEYIFNESIQRDKGDRYLVPLLFFCYTYFEVIELPRNPRDVSKSGVYHIMLRGIRVCATHRTFAHI